MRAVLLGVALAGADGVFGHGGIGPGILSRTGAALARRLPRAGRSIARTAVRAHSQPSPADIEARLRTARSVFDTVDLFIAPSPSIAAEYETLGVQKAKIRMSDYGFPLVPHRAPRRPRRPLLIGYVGTLVWHKGVHVCWRQPVSSARLITSSISTETYMCIRTMREAWNAAPSGSGFFSRGLRARGAGRGV